MQAKPCYHTMERQTSEQVNLYAKRAPPGDPLPNYAVPSDEKIRLATSKLSNGQVADNSRICAKQVKDWLQGIQWEEDPKSQWAPGDGDNWRLFVHLIQAARTYKIILHQLLWIIVVLILKGGRDYHGIGLLGPIWKVIEHIIDHRLDAIELHDSLHGCCNKCRTNAGQGLRSSRPSWPSNSHTLRCSPSTLSS